MIKRILDSKGHGSKERKRAQKFPTRYELWAVIRQIVRYAALYETNPDTFLRDIARKRLITDVIKAHAKYKASLDESDDFIEGCVEWLAKIYEKIKKGTLSRSDAASEIEVGLREHWYFKSILTKNNLGFCVPTTKQIREAGGPIKLATLNIGILFQISERKIYKIREENRRFYETLTDKGDEDFYQKLELMRIFDLPEKIVKRANKAISFDGRLMEGDWNHYSELPKSEKWRNGKWVPARRSPNTTRRRSQSTS